MKQSLLTAALDFALRRPRLGAFLLLAIRLLSLSTVKLRIVRLEGFSEAQGYKTKRLRQSIETTTFGPDFGLLPQCSAIVKTPEICLYQFENARVATPSSTVLLENELLLADTVADDQENRINYSQGHLRRHFGRSAIIRERTAHRLQKGIFLAGNGFFNYYHWLIEILPKVEFLDALPSHLHSHPLLVPECITELPALGESLSIMAGSRELIPISQNTTYQVEDLAFINSASHLPFNLNGRHALRVNDVCIDPRSIAFIRNCALRACLGGARREPGHARIFLCRKGVRRRYNQDSVSATLSRFGFSPVFMEDLSFEEQVRVMQDANAIVGPSGAAWANLAFAKAGTRALCWMAEEAGQFSPFSTIAKLVGVNLKYMTYRAGIDSAVDLYSNDYTIDIGDLEGALVAMNL